MLLRFSVITLAVAAVLAGTATGGSSPTILTGTVVRVVDGDTVRVRARGFDTTARLIGIDTPETQRPGYPVQCGGPAASAEARRLMPPGARVRLVSDPTQDTRDKYGRFLAYVYRDGLGGARGSVNYRMVVGGFAKTYVYGGIPFRYSGEFLGAEIRAKRAVRGVWGPPCNGNTLKPDLAGRRGAAVGSAPRPGCDPNYAGACIPRPPPDLDCRDITARKFRVVGTDVHRFDRDGDGIACEGS
jgi:micrococcal nuclease